MFEKRIKNLDDVIKRYIEELEKSIRVDKVYLYGSYSKHAEHDFSDIDIAVVSPDFEGGTERDYLLLGRAAMKVNTLIEAKPYRPESLINVSPMEFLSEIVRTGKLVYSKAA